MRIRLFLLLALAVPAFLYAKAPADAAPSVTALLKEFLSNVDDPRMHDRFWADDLVYTGGTGVVRTKAEILKSTSEAAKNRKPGEKSTTYTAEDVKVRTYGDIAALTFQLVAHDADEKITNYRNSGTLLWRDNRWQVVTWQATKVATP